MRLTLIHAKWMILELLRQPSYVVSTVSFPALFYAIFALPESTTPEASNMLLASFSCFAVFGVIFLQFGVGIAQERSKAWFYFLKTLPLKGFCLIVARSLSSLFFSILAVLIIVILALSFTKAELTSMEWLKFWSMVLLGGFSFATMGLALGFWTTEKNSLPIGNLLYLPLSFAGGLWKPPHILPSAIRDVSEYLPTRHYGELLWKVVSHESIQIKNIQYVLFYAFVFGIIAFFGYRRDLKERLT